MLNDETLNALAAEVLQAQDRAALMPRLRPRHPQLDLPSAYRLAQRVQQWREVSGWRCVGRKIGFTNAALWPVFGVQAPIWGAMYAHTVHCLASEVAVLSLKGLSAPKIEPEIVLGLKAAPPAGASIEALLGCIDWVAHGFELVQCHFEGWKFDAAETVADGGLHGCLVVGPRQPWAQWVGHASQASAALAKLAELELSLHCDGQLREVGQGRNALGSPVHALAHLLQLLAQQPGLPPLAAGEIITTGTLTQAFDVQPGQIWRSAFENEALPGLDLRFTA